MIRFPRARFILLPLALLACGPANHAPSSTDPRAIASASTPAQNPGARETPPKPTALTPFTLPRVTRDSLSGGARFALVTRTAAPLVETRLVVRDTAGVVDLGTAHLLAAYLNDAGTGPHDGTHFASTLEGLGARLSVGLRREALELSLTAPKSTFRESFALASSLLTQPRWDEAVWKRVKARVADSARSRARTDGQWSVGAVALRELGYLGRPPSFAEVNAPTFAMARELHKKAFVHKNFSLVVVGDIELDAAKNVAELGLASLATKLPPVHLTKPIAVPSELRIVIVDRPKSSQSSVLVALLAPPIASEHALSATLLSACLGDSNAMSNRLFSDVREKRGLAYVLGSDVPLIGNEARPWFTYAATQTARTLETTNALLENIRGLGSLTRDELETAKTLLSAGLAAKMEVARDLGDLIVEQEIFALPEDHWDTLSKRASLESVATLSETFRGIDTEHPLIVINGDADALSPSLQTLGSLSILDPFDFHVVRTVAKGTR